MRYLIPAGTKCQTAVGAAPWVDHVTTEPIRFDTYKASTGGLWWLVYRGGVTFRVRPTFIDRSGRTGHLTGSAFGRKRKPPKNKKA